MLDWQILAQILTAIVALAAFGLSLYLALREKPSLSIEKINAEKKDSALINFRFYLDNNGQKPTTIKEIMFHTDENFIARNKIVILSEKTKPTMGKTLVDKKVQGFELPYHLLPNTSLKLKAELDFSYEHERDKAIKPNDGKGQIHFNIVIKHSKGEFNKRI